MFKILQLDGPIEIFSPTFPESPSEFWVVCKEDRDRLDRLRNDLSNYFKSRPSETAQGNTRPKVGDLGVLKDSNLWRRVQVEFSEGGEVDLRDVDDGSLIQSLNRPLFSLPSEFHSNFMGVRCRLNGVICKGDQLTWPTRALEVFRKYFKPARMRIVGLHSHTHVVDVTLHDNRDMATILLETGVAEHLEVEESLQNFKSVVGLKKCLSRFTLVEEFKPPKLPVRNISKNFDTKQDYWITINHIITPNQFYANFLLDSTMELEQLESDLKTHYKEHSGNNFMVNVYANLYAIKCEPTGSWKRGSIVELDSGKASVFFFDYGHTKTVSLKDLAPLDGKFSILPAQAVCCSADLQGYHWQKQDVEYFVRLVSKSIFSIKIIDKLKDRIIVDFLSDSELRPNLLNFMKAARADFQKLSTGICRDREIKNQQIREDAKDYGYPGNASLLFQDDVVVVAAVESTRDFYIMRMNGGDQKKFQELMEDLRSHCSSADTCESIFLNLPVACKLDKIWARASVCGIEEGRAEVFFVDFGKKMFVRKDEIKTISQKLIEYLPMQCFHCSLKLPGHANSVFCDQWFKNNCKEPIFLVAFANKDGKRHMVDMKRKEDKETVCEKLLHLCSSEANQQSGEVSLPVAAEVHELQEGCQVTVVHVISPSDFYVQRQSKETQKILDDVTTCLNKSMLSPCRRIEEGMLVAVQFEGVWSRAVINEILKDGSLKVIFIDFGNEEVVDKEFVRTAKDRVFAESPYLAQQCRLNGACGRTTAQALNAFKESCLEKTFLVKNLHREAPGLYRLDLLDPETLESAFDVNNILQKQVMFKANTAEHNKTNINMTREHVGGHKPRPNLVQGTSSLPTTGTSVSIKYSNNPFDFYLSEESDDLRMLTTRLNDSSPVKVRSYAKGDIVAATFEELWCRAKILSVLPRDAIRVQFVDYGNIAEVEMGEVKAISQELKDLKPKPVVHCWLALNRNDSMEGSWSQESVEWFKDNCEWKPYKLSCIRDSGVTGSEGEKIYEVELITSQGESLVEELLRKNILPSKARVPENTTSKPLVVRADLGSLDVGKVYKCGLLSSSSPCSFWCQVIDFIIELLGDKMPGAPENKEYEPVVGEICLAFHRVHEEWYRVEVKELNGNVAKVHLIDYEEDLSVPFTHLHQLPPQMRRFPPLAFKCSLQGVSPLAPVWTDEANSYFSSLVADQILDVEIVKSDGNLHWVKIVDSNGLSIMEKMKAIKLAK